ncbi:MAG: hypothetical protein ACREXS_04585 [Gammaproteobacteria bacterium]
MTASKGIQHRARFIGEARKKHRSRVLQGLHTAENARPKKVHLIVGGNALRKAPLDLRTTAGKRYRADLIALVAHIGGEPTIVQMKLIDQAARLGILVDITWQHAQRNPLVTAAGTLHAAVEGFLRSAREQRAVLQLLGLERTARPTNLTDYVERQTEALEHPDEKEGGD